MYDVNETIVDNSTRLKYKILYKNVDNITIVANYANAVPMTLPITFVTENYEAIEVEFALGYASQEEVDAHNNRCADNARNKKGKIK